MTPKTLFVTCKVGVSTISPLITIFKKSMPALRRPPPTLAYHIEFTKICGKAGRWSLFNFFERPPLCTRSARYRRAPGWSFYLIAASKADMIGCDAAITGSQQWRYHGAIKVAPGRFAMQQKGDRRVPRTFVDVMRSQPIPFQIPWRVGKIGQPVKRFLGRPEDIRYLDSTLSFHRPRNQSSKNLPVPAT